jgi:tetratricopeptide (TPR) repeat protein
MRVLIVALAVMLSACATEEAAQAPAASAANRSLAETYNSRGNAQFDARNYAAALVDYDAALRQAPNFAGTLRNRCNTKIALNDLDGALADCEAALRINPPSLCAVAPEPNLHPVQPGRPALKPRHALPTHPPPRPC